MPFNLAWKDKVVTYVRGVCPGEFAYIATERRVVVRQENGEEIVVAATEVRQDFAFDADVLHADGTFN